MISQIKRNPIISNVLITINVNFLVINSFDSTRDELYLNFMNHVILFNTDIENRYHCKNKII